MNHVLRWRLLVVTLLGLYLLAPQPAFASDAVDEAITALKASPVYVAAGIAGTSSDTAPLLARRLRDNDHLLIVMLPAQIDDDSTQKLLTTALQRISEAFDSKKIIGLTVGSAARAAGPTLPAGTTTTLMTRAATVGTTPAETLGTFIDNVHGWQTQHPEPIPPEPPTPQSFLWLWILGGAIVGGGCSFTLRSYLKRRRATVGNLQFTSPDSVNALLRQLLQLRLRVDSNDERMRRALFRVCAQVEAYFDTATTRESTRAADRIEENLEAALKVVNVYLKLQKAPDRYRDARATRELITEKIVTFGDQVHDLVVNAHEHDVDDIEIDLMTLS